VPITTNVVSSNRRFLYSDESDFTQRPPMKNEKNLIRSLINFTETFHYILMMPFTKWSKVWWLCRSNLSLWLEIKDATDTDRSDSYLDLQQEIESNGRLRTTEALCQEKLFQFSHCELFIYMYMYQHSSSICIWGIYHSW
jgi:hypothetical protein